MWAKERERMDDDMEEVKKEDKKRPLSCRWEYNNYCPLGKQHMFTYLYPILSHRQYNKQNNYDTLYFR